MNYKDVTDLKTDIRRLAHDVPTGIDLIVGIPRSGLLAANILCLYLDLPMTDVDRLCRRELIETGDRHGETASFEDIDTALVFDDSVLTGSQMTTTQERLSDEGFPFDLTYGAAYVSRSGLSYVDHWGEVVPRPRVFEWNLMHHSTLDSFCIDIDGVLCRDPTPAENDDGERYRTFLREVEPNVVSNNRIGWLVTCRLEKYRTETEAWLDEHGFEYENLVMMDHPDMAARREAGDHAAFKARVYEETDARLFVESSKRQAVQIHERTNRPVYCYESNEMIHPGTIDQLSRNGTDFLSRFRARPIDFSKSAGKYVVRRFSDRFRGGASRRE